MAATGTKAEREAQLAEAHERLVGRAKRLWAHLNAGTPAPPDAELLAQLETLEEQYEATFRRDGEAEGDRPGAVELPPALALALQTMAEGQAATQAMLLEIAKERAAEQAERNKPREVALDGDAGALAKALDGTADDGGDGENPLDVPVVFRSRGTAFRATMVPRRRFVGPDGMQYFTNGRVLDFAPGGVYSTRNPDNVAWLRARPGMNLEYWEVGKEPHSAPDPELVLDAIIQAALSLDDEALAKIEADERASHKRDAVMKAVASARLRVQGFQSPAAGEEG